MIGPCGTSRFCISVCWASNTKIQFNGIGGLQTYISKPDADDYSAWPFRARQQRQQLPCRAFPQTKGQTSMSSSYVGTLQSSRSAAVWAASGLAMSSLLSRKRPLNANPTLQW